MKPVSRHMSITFLMLSFHVLPIRVADDTHDFVLCSLLVPEQYDEQTVYRCITLVHAMMNQFRGTRHVDQAWRAFVGSIPFIRFNQLLFHEREDDSSTRMSSGITRMYIGDTKLELDYNEDIIETVSKISQCVMKVYITA